MKFRLVNAPLSGGCQLQRGVRRAGRTGLEWFDWHTVGIYPNEEAAMEAAREYKAHYDAMNTTYKVFEL